MPSYFSAPTNHKYKSGQLFLGLDPDTGDEVGISTERHAITIAGSGSGKGAALLIPNLLRWPHNALTVDPKGENAEETWQAREAMGQTVGILDPFHVANVPDRLRVSVNFLAAIDVHSRTARADIEVLADGLVKRHDPKHAEWDNAKADLLAGILAFVIAAAPPEHRTMSAMRKVLLQPNAALYEDAQRMLSIDACGGLARTAGIMLMTALDSDKGIEKDALSGARRCTSWIDDSSFAEVLGPSTFDMTALKNGRASLYLVLPVDYLATKGEFLRLFVRASINIMMRDGKSKRKCLFLLDEFSSLGKLDTIPTVLAAGRSAGIRLWPFLQDLGQLTSLYGPEGAQTFFGNSDAHIYFGNTDSLTLEFISKRIGDITPHDLPAFASSYEEDAERHSKAGGKAAKWGQHGVAADLYTRAMQAGERARRAEQEHRAIVGQWIGRPRVAPDKVKEIVAKKDGDEVARAMLVFAKGSDIFRLTLAPYFRTYAESIKATATSPAPKSKEEIQAVIDKAYGGRKRPTVLKTLQGLRLNLRRIIPNAESIKATATPVEWKLSKEVQAKIDKAYGGRKRRITLWR